METALDKEAERTFEGLLEPLIEEEQTVDYAVNALLLKMITDWPTASDPFLTRYDFAQVQ